MKCPECVEKGLKSMVTIKSMYCTDSYYLPFFDQDGIYHIHDNNDIINDYYCSNNHNFKINYKEKCPHDECDFNKEDK